MKEEILIDGQLCAIILPASYDEPGIHFFTSAGLVAAARFNVLCPWQGDLGPYAQSRLA